LMEEEKENGHLQCWQLFWVLAHFMHYIMDCKKADKLFNYFNLSPKPFEELSTMLKDLFHERGMKMWRCTNAKERLATTLLYVRLY
jgi:hypothetical protein